ncbi:MAG: helix-turn-helix domain-containing protein [Propionivibrio sp.]
MRTLTRDEYFPNRDSAISIVPESPQPPLTEHGHEFEELVIVRSGSAIHYHDGKPTPINRGSVMYIGPRQTHVLDQLDDLYLTNLLILPYSFKHAAYDGAASQLAKSAGVDSSPYMIDGITLKRAEFLLDRIAEEVERCVEYSEQMIELLASQLIIELWRNQPKDKDASQDDNENRFTKLLRHLSNHFEDEIDWNSIACRFEISSRTIRRRICDVTGLSPNKYLLRIRICNAMRMLRETPNSVTDVAFSCGFNDSNYFTDRFHREIGITPTQYRRRFDQTRG